jgi:PKD repeat protein
VTASVFPTTTTQYGTVNFTGGATGGTPPYHYEWNFGNIGPYGEAENSTQQDPMYSDYEEPGNYTAVLVVVDSAGQSSSASAMVLVNAGYGGPLVVTSASVYSGRAPLTVQFQANASGFPVTPSYSWNFRDGQSGSGASVSHTFETIGIFDVSEQSGDIFSDYASYDLTIVVGPAHVAVQASSLPSPATGTAPLTVNFTANGTGWLPPLQYNWSFGDGSPAVATTNASHRYVAAGTYSARVLVSDDLGESVSAMITVTVGAPPELVATAQANVTSGAPPLKVSFGVNLSGGVPPYTYDWNFGDGQSSTSEAPSHTFATANTYDVALTVTDSSGQNVTSQLNITVEGPSSSSGSSTASLLESPFLWIGIVAVIVIVAASAILLSHRRPPAAESGEELAPAGAEEPPAEEPVTEA